MADYNHENLASISDLERDNPASIADAEADTELSYSVSWENFLETPSAPNTCILYTHSLQDWLVMTLCLLVFWTIWLVMLVACTRHYAGQFASLTTPVAVCGFGLLLMFLSILSPPQTMIFRNGSPLFTYIIGFEGFGVRFFIPLTTIRGLSLIRVQVSLRQGGGKFSRFFVTWKGIWFLTQIGSYVNHELALARAEYISMRTGLPIIGSEMHIVQSPKSGQTKERAAK